MTTQQVQNNFNSSQENSNVYINSAINNMLLQVNTIFLAQITAITGSTCTIQPIIQMRTINQQTPFPPTITNVPLGQLIGGTAGFIAQYKVNDIVLCGAVQRDISSIKSNWKSALPASNRKFSISDAVVLFQMTNNVPTTFVKVTDIGIDITAASGNPINITTTGQANINAGTVKLGNSASNPILLQNVAMVADIGGVQPGSGVSGVTVTISAGGISKVQGAI